MFKAAQLETKSLFGRIDYGMLIFIIGVSHVKLYIKLIAVVFYLVYILYKKYSLRKSPTRLALFYLLMPAAGLAGALLHGSFGNGNYKYVYLLGAGIWILSAVVSWLVYLSVTNVSLNSLVATLKAFFMLNFGVSLVQLMMIMWSAHDIMPYWLNDAAEQYGVSTGDYIRGISGNTSVVNAAIASLGILFFYFRREWKWLTVCLVTMVLCTSNLTLLCFLATLLVVLIFYGDLRQKLRTALLFFSVVGLYWLVSSKNIIYIANIFIKIFTRGQGPPSERQLYYQAHKEAFFRLQPKDQVYDNYRMKIAQLRESSAADTLTRHSILSRVAVGGAIEDWYGMPADSTPLYFVNTPGKLYAFKQSMFYWLSDAKNAIAGAGMGNFSSRLALKATSLGIEGNYPEKYTYLGRDFVSYHFYTILYYFSRSESEHSVVNMPDNVYDQLLGEYGLVGICLFLVCYLGFFFRYRKRLAAGRYILCLTLLFFGYAYWFEMISLTVFFELLMFMDIFTAETNGVDPDTHNSIDAGL